MGKLFDNEKLRFNISCSLILLVLLFLVISLINDSFSRAMSTAWDGTTVATNFAGGNGSSSSPYLISNGEELAFFRNVIQDNNNVYSKLYYQLADDIDMGNHDFTTINNNFSGHFDGRGYSINNVKFTKSTINDVDYYGLFSYVTDGSIENITINNVTISTEASTLDVVTGIVAGKVLPESEATLKNIAITNATLNVTNTTESEDNLLGGVVGLIGYNSHFDNIYTQINLTSNYSTGVGSLVSTINSDPGVTISKTTSGNNSIVLSTYSNSNDVVNMENQFIIGNDNKIYLDGNEVNNSNDYQVITNLLSLNNGDYVWNYVSGRFTLVYSPITPSTGFSFESSVFTPTASSVDTANNVTTLNMLEEDYNYFKGLDYTEVRGPELPPAAGYGYYNSNTLVAVQITYDGSDISDDRLVGAVSPIANENTNKFVYYKYYALERNSNGTLATDSQGRNYIKIELIDNPFSKRPYVTNVEYGFNGWVCNQNSESSANICNSSRFEFDYDDYTRYMIIPVDGGSQIKIYLNASWHRANVIQDNNATANDLTSGFHSMSMQPATHVETTYTQMTGYIRWKNNYATFTQNGTVGYYGRVARYTYYKDDIDSNTYYYSGNNRPYCTNYNGCPTYTVNQTGITINSLYNGGTVEFVPNFVANNTNNSVTVNGYDPNYMNFVEDPNGNTYNVPNMRTVSDLYDGTTAGGYFYRVTGTTATMVNTREYYTADGVLCTNAANCNTSYKLIHFNDSMTNTDGTSIYNINYAGDDPSTPEDESQAVNMDRYYYLVTRDQNIFRFTGNNLNRDVLQVNRPFTVTGTSATGTTVSGSINVDNTTLTAQNDLVIENIHIYGLNNNGTSNQDFGYSNNTNPVLICNSKNVKIGRNVTSSRNANYVTFANITAGTNGGTATSGKIKIIVESGFYNAYRVTNSTTTSNFNLTSILGSDYDKATGTNSKLRFMVGVIGMTSSGYTYNKGNDSPFLTLTYLRSGYYGYNPNGTPSTAADGSGIYVGGRGGSTRPGGPCGVKIEGGIVNMILGGSGKYGGDDDDNLIYVGMSSGSIRQVYAGATQSATRGNRIVNITGGSVGGSVFGGSKSTSSSVGNGSINATALVYVGGTANIGTETGNVYDIAPGSVFGAGAGNASNLGLASVRNSHVIIDGGTINGNVYGGGNYGAVGSQQATSVSTLVEVKDGNVKGDVYGGSNSNGFSQNAYRDSSHIDVNIYGGTIEGGVYGGSDTRGVCYGTVNVNIINGTVGEVFGGGRGGYRDNNNQGTFVYGDVNVNIGSTSVTPSEPQIKGNVYGGSAFGTVNSNDRNANSSNYETKVTVNSGTVLKSVFGGGMGGNDGGFNYTPNVAGDATTTINGGNIGNVFGGNDAASYVKGDVQVYLNGGTIGNVYGGGNSTGQPTPYVYEQGSTVNNIFGGSNVSGTVNESNVTVTSGNIGNVFGGNNAGGNTTTTRVTVNGGTFSGDIYGGGFAAESTTTNVIVNAATVNDIYGGGQKAGATTTNVNTNGTTCDEVFGGSNISGEISNRANVTCRNTNGTAAYGAGNKANANNTTVNMYTSTIESVYGGGNAASASNTSTVNINSGTYDSVYGGGNAAGEHTSVSATINYINGTSNNVFGGSNASGDITTTTVNIGTANGASINNPNMNIYGGNNAGGKVQTTNVNLDKVTCNDVFGGGNEAIVGRTNVIATANTTVNDLYGGGNAAGVTKTSEGSTIDPNTYVKVVGTTVNGNLFGGGNEGIVSGNTDVYITDGEIHGNAYAGGNGASAIVYGNSTVTIDGDTVVGTATSTAPQGGCVFGSGNAASTGDDGEDSNSTVNIAGGHIYGNVYGGAKMSTVYGVATLNIGYNSIPNNSSLEKTDIQIDGSVYGGGESNESGSETYDWNAYSVMKGIDVNIDGTGYTDFGVHGNVFGSGNASTSKGYSYVDILNVGTASKPNTMLSIQRTDICTIDSSFVEVIGQEDITNEQSSYKYSFNRINELIIKNNTTLLVQNNANLVKAFTSGYDDGNTFKKNSIDIDDDGNTSNLKTDNRLYTLSGINFNVNTNEAATEFGKVTGMTFFGMYKSDGNDYVYGLYDKNVSNGDNLTASDFIYGGSYVQGLNYSDYDYTEDGFYSNFFEDDDYNKPVYVAYIDPKKMGENCNRWVIGKNLTTYKINLNVTPFGSAGTEILSMGDFSGSNVIYEIESFDSGQLNPGINLVEKANVPRIAATEADANSTFALSVKTESQEWTNVNTTNMYSANGGVLNGDREYRTDNTNSVPKLNFYLYHSKNVTTKDELGKCSLYMTVYVPVTAIDYSIETVQVEITILGKEINSEAYASAINYGKYYDVFTMGTVNITSTSQFSTYYSLTLFDKEFNDIYGNNAYHALTTDSPLPVGTMVTMIDFAQGSNPITYYYEVDAAGYAAAQSELATSGEVNYALTNFRRMSSTNTNYMYSDATANTLYYNPTTKLVDEEFIFIFDFSQTDGSYIVSNKSMLFNLYNEVGGVTNVVANVYGNNADQMIYSTYLNDNQILNENITDYSTYVYHNSSNNVKFSTEIGYDKTEQGVAIVDTNYNSSAMGLNVRLYDSSNNPVASNKLIGTYFVYNGQNFFADADGTFRIKLAGKVSEVSTNLVLVTDDTIDEGTYTLEYTLFASEDGLHNNDDRSVSKTYTVSVISSQSSIVVDCEDEAKLVIGETGMNASGDATNEYSIKVTSGLSNLQVMLEVQKRNIDTIDTVAYSKVSFSSLFSNSFSANSNNEVALGITTSGTHSVTLNINPVDNLTSGTYRLNFKLYDNGVLIDSEYKYVIVDKQVDND